MAHVEPLGTEDLAPLAPVLAGAEAAMGFVPNSMKTMAHMPQLTVAFSLLAGTVFGGDLKATLAALSPHIPEAQGAERNLTPELVQLIAYACSVSAGCRYCQAHTSHSGHRQGADEAKFADVLNYADDPLFSPAERAAVGLALAAGAVPNEATPAHFDALAEHFDSRQIVQIVAVISLFGFLNRWNDTMATQLEESPVAFAQRVLAPGGWEAGKHA